MSGAEIARLWRAGRRLMSTLIGGLGWQRGAAPTDWPEAGPETPPERPAFLDTEASWYSV